MRKLHLVGVTDDQKGLIFSGRRGSKSGGYVVQIEDDLIGAIADARRTSDGAEPPELAAVVAGDEDQARRRARPNSSLTPREIQARLRAGHSIADVAAEAEVDADWVERFAIPILAEQAQVVEHARMLSYSKPRLGQSSETLERSVAVNLAERGVRLPEDIFDLGWSAYQLHDTVWVVRFRYHSRGRLQEAAWELDAETDFLTSRNRLASELGFVERGRRRRKPVPGSDGPDDEEPPPPPSRRAKAKPRAKRAPTAKKAATKAPARARKATASKRSTNTAPPRKRTGSSAKKSTAPRAAPARRAAKSSRSTVTRATRNAATEAKINDSRTVAMPRTPRASMAATQARAGAPSDDTATATTPTPVFAMPSVEAAPPRRAAPLRESSPSAVRPKAGPVRPKAGPASPVSGDIDIESLLEPAPPPPPPVDVEDVGVPLLVRRVRAKRAVIAAPAASEAADRGSEPAPADERSGETDSAPPLRIRRQLRFGPVPAS